jgi:hypothetical protein
LRLDFEELALFLISCFTDDLARVLLRQTANFQQRPCTLISPTFLPAKVAHDSFGSNLAPARCGNFAD